MKYVNILISIAFVSLFISCQDEITVDIPDSDKKLVVDAWIRADTNLNVVRLSRSANFSENGLDFPETNAQVFIANENGFRIDFVEDSAGKYIYEQNPNFVVNEFYEMNIVTNDGVSFKSSPEQFLEVQKIDGLLFFTPNFLADFGFPDGFFGEGVYPSITTVEKPGKGDFYAWKIFINGEDLGIGNNLFTQTDQTFVDGATIPYGVFIWADSVGIDEAGRGDTVTIEQMSISEDSFDFINAVNSQLNGGGPFSTPPAPVKSNVFREDNLDEVVLGRFILSDSEKKTEIVRPELVVDNIDFLSIP